MTVWSMAEARRQALAEARALRRGPCRHCRNGDHERCTGVACYGCRDGHRLPGQASKGDLSEVTRTRRKS